MKKLSGTIKVGLLTAFVILCAVALRSQGAKPDYPSAKFTFKCDNRRALKAGHEDVAHFKKVLDDHHAVYYCMVHKHKNGKETPLKSGNCPVAVSSTSTQNADGGEFTLICAGAHVTQVAGLNTQADLDAVAAEFE
jgi:hypothetical protein